MYLCSALSILLSTSSSVLQQGREDVFKLRNVRIEQVVLCQCRVNGHRGRSTLEGGLDSLVYQTEGWGEMRAASDI